MSLQRRANAPATDPDTIDDTIGTAMKLSKDVVISLLLTILFAALICMYCINDVDFGQRATFSDAILNTSLLESSSESSARSSLKRCSAFSAAASPFSKAEDDRPPGSSCFTDSTAVDDDEDEEAS